MNVPRPTSLVSAILFAIVALGVFSTVWPVSLGCGLALIFNVIFKKKIQVDTIGQIIALLFTGAVVYSLFFIFEISKHNGTPLSQLGWALATLFLLAVVIRQYIEHPFGGENTDAFLLFWAWLCLGFSKSNPLYVPFVVVGVAFILMGIFFSKAQKRKPSNVSKLSKRIMGGMTLIVLIIGGGFFITIPLAYDWTMNRFLDSFAIRQTGFSPLLELGSVKKMIQSDEVALRIFNAKKPTRHLRGAVYNKYQSTRWSLSATLEKTIFESSLKAKRGMRIQSVKGANTLFLPLNTSAVFSKTGLSKNNVGIVYATGRDELEEYYIEQSSKRNLIELPPIEQDLHVPSSIRTPLMNIAKRWVKMSDSDEVKIKKIKKRLKHNYAYSLEFKRDGKTDPLIDFLTQNKQGHCEYFASSFALLARSVGVPTRIVGGYYVNEYNPYGKYYIVREKNAHTWVEAWVSKKGWVTVEATPSASLATQGGTVSLFLDLIPIKVKQLIEFIGQMNRWVVLLTIAFLLAVWGIVRLFRKRKHVEGESAATLEYRDVDEIMVQLQYIFKREVPRGKSESIEQWIQKFDMENVKHMDAVFILKKYSAWRFGKRGQRSDIQSHYSRWLFKYQKHTSIDV